MSNKDFYENTRKRITWDILQDNALSQSVLNNVLRFHQSSVFFQNREVKGTFLSPEIKAWLTHVEFTDVLPDVFEEEIPLYPDPITREGSNRNYDVQYQMDDLTLANIFAKAFGRGKNGLSKRYPSAGGLYPVLPLLFVFKESAITRISSPGVYMFNPFTYSLYRVKSWSEEDLENLKSAILTENGEFISNYAIAYSIDVRRAIAKYRKRGYRHALIEVGLMAQAFRESLKEVDDSFGDLSWSGFNDNALTYLSGLNVRLAPIALLQWFGKKREGVQNDI